MPTRRALKVVPPSDVIEEPDELLTAAEVGKMLKRSSDAVRQMVMRGQLPGYRIGERGIRFKRKEIYAYVANLPRA